MKKHKSLFIWIFSLIFTLFIAWYQRTTGPSYPVSGEITLNSENIAFTLPRTSDDVNGQTVKVKVTHAEVTGYMEYMRYKSFDSLTRIEMKREGDYLTAVIPPQPPAGKVMYKVYMVSGNDKVSLTADPVVIRYKGVVPASVLIPHILLMFLAMLFSTRTGLEALFNLHRTYRYTFITLVLLFVGGGLLGPIVQKYAFGAYWTGWPFGHDLTDNKTLVALIFWAVAFFKLSRNKYNRKWVIIAAVILLAVYLVPHSVLGSELDYTKTP